MTTLLLHRLCLVAGINEQLGGVIFVGGLVLALASFITGIVFACSQRENKWLKALLFGIGLPIVLVGVSFAGCAMAMKGL